MNHILLAGFLLAPIVTAVALVRQVRLRRALELLLRKLWNEWRSHRETHSSRLLPLILLLAGCGDGRVVTVTREADERQAKQNDQMARLVNEETAFRQQAAKLQNDLRADGAGVAQQRDALEIERKRHHAHGQDLDLSGPGPHALHGFHRRRPALRLRRRRALALRRRRKRSALLGPRRRRPGLGFHAGRRRQGFHAHRQRPGNLGGGQAGASSRPGQIRLAALFLACRSQRHVVRGDAERLDVGRGQAAVGDPNEDAPRSFHAPRSAG